MSPSTPLILIVDDFIDALDMYAMCFELHGYRVVTAATDGAAIRMGPLLPPRTARHDPDTIFGCRRRFC
jgi:CheY-like chemotaxis protein